MGWVLAYIAVVVVFLLLIATKTVQFRDRE